MRTSLTRERLARQVTGSVFDGGDPAAAAETAGFNTAVTHRPAVVVAASTAGDVAAAVRYANDEGLAVAVQATGHGAAAPSDGTVFVSTRRMQGVEVDPVARVARVQAGVRWRSVIDAAVPHGLAPLSGSSSGVGVVGYTLGGGMGHLARRHGFAADHVRSVELVTARGEIRTVDAESDPELFWAVRGGQGRFGIVSALEFDLFPVPRFFGGAMIFAAARHRGGAARLRDVGADDARRGHHLGRVAAAAPDRAGAAADARSRQPGAALRLHRLTRAGRGTARTDAQGRDPGAGLRRPDVVRRGRQHPHGPAGAAASRGPGRAAALDARRAARDAARGGRSRRGGSAGGRRDAADGWGTQPGPRRSRTRWRDARVRTRCR